jgi:hypothetical protein
MNNERLGEHYNRYTDFNVNEWNREKLNSNVIKNSNDTQLSLVREPTITYSTYDYYLCVTSASRDLTQYPSESNYVVHFDTPYKNVSSIELIQTIIPDKNNVTYEPYLLLNIQEISDVMASNNQLLLDAFAIIQLAPPTTTGKFINTDKRIHENIPKVFRTPVSLSRMSIKITDNAGTVFDFGGGSTADKQYQNTMIFKITCLEKSRDSLNYRNVY